MVGNMLQERMAYHHSRALPLVEGRPPKLSCLKLCRFDRKVIDSVVTIVSCRPDDTAVESTETDDDRFDFD